MLREQILETIGAASKVDKGKVREAGQCAQTLGHGNALVVCQGAAAERAAVGKNGHQGRVAPLVDLEGLEAVVGDQSSSGTPWNQACST